MGAVYDGVDGPLLRCNSLAGLLMPGRRCINVGWCVGEVW